MEQFAERANQTFAGLLDDSLDDALKLPNQWINTFEMDDEKKTKSEGGKTEDKKDSLSSDNFNKPKVSGLKRNKCIPDHTLNPEKWTKYDLSNVKLSSNAVNAQSALSFLNDLQKRKHSSDTSSSKG